MKHSLFLLVFSALVTGCFTGPHAVNIRKAENLGSPQNVAQILNTLQTVFGPENTKHFDSGNLIDIFVGGGRNALKVERALQNLCNRMFPKTMLGRPTSSSSIHEEVYLGFDLGIPIPIAKHFAQGISTINAQLAPNSELSPKIGRRGRHESRFRYCPSYPDSGIVHIVFGWQLMIRNNMSSFETFISDILGEPKDYHILIAKNHYFRPLIEEYKPQYDAHIAKKQQRRQEAILKAEERRRSSEQEKKKSQERERRSEGI